jgi:hypothetical protein
MDQWCWLHLIYEVVVIAVVVAADVTESCHCVLVNRRRKQEDVG